MHFFRSCFIHKPKVQTEENSDTEKSPFEMFVRKSVSKCVRCCKRLKSARKKEETIEKKTREKKNKISQTGNSNNY